MLSARFVCDNNSEKKDVGLAREGGNSPVLKKESRKCAKSLDPGHANDGKGKDRSRCSQDEKVSQTDTSLSQ